MPTIPAGNSLVTHVHNCPAPGGNKLMTVTYGVANFPDAVLAEYLHETYNTFIWSILGHVNSELVETVVRDEVTAANFVQVDAGGNTNEPLPPNTALLVRKGTGLIGRPYRGRMYMPSMIFENDILNNGTMDSADRDSYQGHFDNWLDELQTGMATNMVLLHSAAIAPTVVTDLTVDATIATQRRRLR